MFRISAKYGALAQQIELDYRRDLTIAESEVIVIALAVWLTPLVLLYALGYLLSRRAPAPVPVRQRAASVDDPRYLPAQSPENNGGKQ